MCLCMFSLSQAYIIFYVTEERIAGWFLTPYRTLRTKEKKKEINNNFCLANNKTIANFEIKKKQKQFYFFFLYTFYKFIIH